MSNRAPAGIRRSAPLTLGKLLVVPLLAATTACIPTVKSVFVDLSYPDDPPKSAGARRHAESRRGHLVVVARRLRTAA